MNNGHWILVNDKLQKVDLMTWAKWFEDKTNPGRITKQTYIGNVFVSTVFLGIDHNFGEGKPLLWETMMFNSKKRALSSYQERYSTLKEAKAGHKRAVQFVEKLLTK
jgi:hypothetical protein